VLVAKSPAELLADPLGAYVAGASWLYGVLAPDVYALVMWGTPGDEDTAALAARLVIELCRPPHATMVDLSALERIEPAAFDHLLGYFRDHRAPLGQVVTQAAVVLPSGLNRAVASGFFHVVPAPFAVRYGDSVTEALASLGHRDPERGRADLQQARAEVEQVSLFVRTVRGYLADHLDQASVASTARALGTSERSLQRSLATHGTTFADELQEARIRAAERRLRDDDRASLTEIALAVGAGSAAHFSALYRKRRGETPSEYRARLRLARTEK
jgi:AraC-like DNA-binding protein